MSNDNIVRSTPEEEATGLRFALDIAISALIVTHPHPQDLKRMLVALAKVGRQRRFDESGAACFIRDAYDRAIDMYTGMIDEAQKLIAGAAAKRASDALEANQDGADAA